MTPLEVPLLRRRSIEMVGKARRRVRLFLIPISSHSPGAPIAAGRSGLAPGHSRTRSEVLVDRGTHPCFVPHICTRPAHKKILRTPLPQTSANEALHKLCVLVLPRRKP